MGARSRGAWVTMSASIITSFALPAAPGTIPDSPIQKTGEKYDLAVAQRQATMEEREPVRVATLAEFAKNPQFANEGEHAAIPDS